MLLACSHFELLFKYINIQHALQPCVCWSTIQFSISTRVATLLVFVHLREEKKTHSSTVEFLTTRPYGGRWSSRGPEVRVRFLPWSIRRCRFKSCRGQTFCNICVGIKTSGGLHASEKLTKKKQIVPIFSTPISIETKFFPSQFCLEYITAQFGRLKTPCWCGWRRVMLKTMIMTPKIQLKGSPHIIIM